MSDDLLAAVRPLLDHLFEVLGRTPAGRAEAAKFAREFAELARALAVELERPAESSAPVPAAPAPPPPTTPATTPAPPARWRPFEWTPAAPPTVPAYTPPSNGVLSLLPLAVLATRCRVKADGARLIARRLAGDDVAAEQAVVEARAARLPDCDLWMLGPHGGATASRVWDDLAGAFELGAAAAELLDRWGQEPPIDAARVAPEVLAIAAEAQSTLLYAVADARMVQKDFEQVQLFAHVRQEAKERQIFIRKYLKREDRADPANWPDVLRRVTETSARLQSTGDRSRNRLKLLGNLRYKLRKIAEQPDQTSEEWPRVVGMIDEVIADGLPPSNVELRDLVLPVLDHVPEDDLPPNVVRVLREVETYLATRPEDGIVSIPEPPSTEVAAVAELLRGRELVLIGGHVRPEHEAALAEAFGLAGVRWLSTPEHTSFTFFEPDIARPEVAVVLLAIRWSSHDYAEVKRFCERYDKPLVRLPRGYNRNQVAYEILRQAGHRLRSAATAS
jgi:hypothetical protein